MYSTSWPLGANAASASTCWPARSPSELWRSGLDPGEVVQAVVGEFDMRGHPVDSAQVVAPVDDEPDLLSARNRMRGTIVDIRGGEQIVEVRFRVRDNSEIVAVVTRSSLERLRLQTGKPLRAHIKATEITLSR